jgi:hypothetical protein
MLTAPRRPLRRLAKSFFPGPVCFGLVTKTTTATAAVRGEPLRRISPFNSPVLLYGTTSACN